MQRQSRFGRRISVPSTAEIKHELRLMASADALVRAGRAASERQGLSKAQLDTLVGNLHRAHGLSFDRAHMLVAKFGSDRHRLDEAAQDLASWKH